MAALTARPHGSPVRDVTIQRIRRGAVVAEINTRGAGIRALSVHDVDLVQRYIGESPPGMAGAVMVPWPNRIDGGRWMFDGSVQQLEITDPEFYSALHGLLTSTDYLVDDQSASSVTLSAPIRNAIGYPFELATSVRYSLTETGVGVRHRITNHGTRSAPVAIGTHPYLRVGDAEPISLAVRVPAGLIATLDDRHLPLGWESVAGTTFDLRNGVPLCEIPRHASFGGFDRSGAGLLEMALTDQKGNQTVLWADESFDWAQVWVTDSFAGPEGGLTAIALEPMTAPPNSLASGEGLNWIEPGGTWDALWGIDYRPRADDSFVQAFHDDSL